jgi:hypothetical protein
MHARLCLSAVVSFLCIGGQHTTAQAPAATDALKTELPEVRVRPKRAPDAAAAPRVPAWQWDSQQVEVLQASLLGVSVLARQNEVQDAPLIVRGFGARAGFGTRGVRIEVDGIPQSGPDGQGQLGLIAPGARRLRWLVGPAASIYGFNAAAVLQSDSLPAQADKHVGRESLLQSSVSTRGAYQVRAGA